MVVVSRALAVLKYVAAALSRARSRRVHTIKLPVEHARELLRLAEIGEAIDTAIDNAPARR